jgi:hypothetical protein
MHACAGTSETCRQPQMSFFPFSTVKKYRAKMSLHLSQFDSELDLRASRTVASVILRTRLLIWQVFSILDGNLNQISSAEAFAKRDVRSIILGTVLAKQFCVPMKGFKSQNESRTERRKDSYSYRQCKDRNRNAKNWGFATLTLGHKVHFIDLSQHHKSSIYEWLASPSFIPFAQFTHGNMNTLSSEYILPNPLQSNHVRD